MVADIYPGYYGSNPGNFTPSGTSLYFTAYSPSSAYDLWRVDTTNGVTSSIGDIWMRGDYALVSMLDAAGTLVYAADYGGAGVELRGIDSSGASVLLADINPSGSSNPQWLTYSGGKVYFSADDGVSGAELWSYDITTNTLASVADIRAGSLGSAPEQLMVLGSDIFFTADGGPQGRELWKFDGIAVAMVKDIAGSGTNSSNPGIYNSNSPVFSPKFTVLNGKLLFGADDGRHGIELWGSDGTAGGTALIKDINSRVSESLPPGSVAPKRTPLPAIESNPVILNGMAYFVAFGIDDNRGLWKTDGTEAGTALVKNGYLSGLTVANGKIYFYGSLGTGTGLCKSDGTTAGTVLVKALPIVPEGLVASGNLLFFAGTTATTGRELWKSDGTATGTVMVKDINAGPIGSLLLPITDLNGAVVFTAYTPSDGYELWRSDGTSAGTYQLKDTLPGAASGEPVAMVNADGTLYFLTRTSIGSGELTELWTSDGTPSGTVRVAIVGSVVDSLTAVGGKVFFQNGADLWISDGSSAGTGRVKSGLNPRNLTNVFGTLYFSADDGTHGRELWKSDGTAAGTVMVQDINVGTGGSAPGTLTEVDGQLYFTASVPQFGRELWKLDIAYPDATVLSASANGAATVNVTYQVSPSDVSTPFGLRFYRSLDGIIDATDTDLGVVMASDASVGVHSQSFTIGSDIFLPGFGVAEIDGDYQILVAPREDPIASVSLTGAYHAPNGGVFVHGGAGSDSITITTSGVNTVVTVSGVASYSYATTDIAVSGFRVRSHGGDDTISGAASPRSLFAWGGAGSDILTGSAAVNDTLIGGTGDDVYVFVAATAAQTDTLTELANEGVDRLDFSTQASTVGITVNLASATTTLATHTNRTVQVPVAGAALWFEQVTGGSGNDTLVGNGSANVLIGGAGNDALTGGEGDDVLTGGEGNDIYNFGPAVASQSDTVIELGNGGIDRLDFSSLDASNSIAIDLSTAGLNLGGHNNRSIFVGVTGQSFQIENVTGGSGNDTISGNSANNSIIGGAGDDTLAGGNGIDSIAGGVGIDVFVESANWSTFTLTDTAFNAGINESLSSIERAILIGGISNNTFNASGFSGPVTIQGGSGNDTITGGKSDDMLVGGPGDDVYLFGGSLLSQTDTVVELAGEGRDRLDFASLTVSDPLTLDLKNDTTLAAHLNRTIRTGGTGQSTNFEDATGGSGNDTLTGSALFNILIGNAGNDVLNGGEGSDNLIGGTGNDTYIFGTAFSVQTDTITELNGGGTDRIDFSTLLIGDNLNVNFAAQNFATHTNRIVRATDANQLNFFEDVFGGAGNDVIVGNTANNVLSGGDGDDTLIGLTGNDAYVFGPTSADQIDSIVESASGGTDLLDFSALGYNDPVIVNLLGGSTTVATHAHRVVQVSAVVGAAQFENVLGGDGDDTLTGNAGVNTLTGGAGNDRLAGGTGNDTYVFDADLMLGSDTIDEAVGAGSDLLSFTLTTTTPVTMSLGTLGSQVVVAGKLSIELLSDAVIENITAGTQGGTFTGNSLANILTGGAGSDTLNGGNGDDLLIGNAGNDILNGGLQNDVYQFDVDLVLGSDTINDTLGVDALDFALTTTVGITLDLAVTSLQALHATNLSLTLSVGTVIETVLGTAKDDTIRGNDADNILVGNAGNDVLQGRAGRDILIGGLGADTLDGGANDDILIGGKTTSDAVINKLNDIRTEWISANWYGIRLANLRAGVGASNTSLKAKVNVTNDATSGSVDTLTGGSDEDWYFKAVDDIVTDLFAGEFLDLL